MEEPQLIWITNQLLHIASGGGREICSYKGSSQRIMGISSTFFG